MCILGGEFAQEGLTLLKVSEVVQLGLVFFLSIHRSEIGFAAHFFCFVTLSSLALGFDALVWWVGCQVQITTVRVGEICICDSRHSTLLVKGQRWVDLDELLVIQ